MAGRPLGPPRHVFEQENLEGCPDGYIYVRVRQKTGRPGKMLWLAVRVKEKDREVVLRKGHCV